MQLSRKIAAGYAVALGIVTFLNYVPGLQDDQGRLFGIFALDIFDDALHFASAAWAAVAAYRSARAARVFLQAFGALYLADGAMGLMFGSGYLDLGILIYGVVPLSIGFKILANLPHIALGGFGLASGLYLARKGEADTV